MPRDAASDCIGSNLGPRMARGEFPVLDHNTDGRATRRDGLKWVESGHSRVVRKSRILHHPARLSKTVVLARYDSLDTAVAFIERRLGA